MVLCKFLAYGRHQPPLYWDMHAITTANNALSALIDNHLHQGNELGIDQRRIIWKRVVDLNDRARHVTVGLGSPDEWYSTRRWL